MVPDICSILFAFVELWGLVLQYILLLIEEDSREDILSVITLLNLLTIFQLLSEWIHAFFIMRNISGSKLKLHKVIRLMNGYRLVVKHGKRFQN